MGHRFEDGDAQRESPFFKKLPLELPRAIYHELLGSSHVHIKSSRSGLGATGFQQVFCRAGAPTRVIPAMWHCICRHWGADPHPHTELSHKWLYLATQLLFTCKKAFEEGIAILYATNTFIFEQNGDWSIFSSMANPYLCLIRCIDLVITKTAYCHFDAIEQLRHLSNRDNQPPRRPTKVRVLLSEEFMHRSFALLPFCDEVQELFWVPASRRPRVEIIVDEQWPERESEHDRYVREILEKFEGVRHIEITRKMGLRWKRTVVEESDAESYGIQSFNEWVPEDSRQEALSDSDVFSTSDMSETTEDPDA